VASSSDPIPVTSAPNLRFRSLRLTYIKEWGVKSILIACSTLSVFVTVAIVVVLFTEATAFFHADDVYCNATISVDGTTKKCGTFVGTSTHETAGTEVACPRCGALHEMPAPVTLVGFLTGTEWEPLIGRESEKKFGVWALISGTLLVSVIAMMLALPLGLITAIYLSEYAHHRVRSVIKPTLEVLAGIPTVVYGFFALTVITPGLKLLNDGFSTYNAMSGGLAVGILCLPIVSSLVEDALQAVPRSLREGAYGLGATKFEVSTKVVVPAALSGVISAFLLAVSRAIGETMIVALAVGSRPQMSFDPRNDMQTMTGWMVQMALGDVSNFDVEYLSMYAVAAVLFVITLLLTFSGNLVRYRFREEYQ
jgi:phosphate transport system permease protein